MALSSDASLGVRGILVVVVVVVVEIVVVVVLVEVVVFVVVVVLVVVFIARSCSCSRLGCFIFLLWVVGSFYFLVSVLYACSSCCCCRDLQPCFYREID